MTGLVLDSQALSLLVDQRGTGYDDVRAAMTAARDGGKTVFVPAAVLAEQFTTAARHKALSSWLNRHDAAITVRDTDTKLARKVGELLTLAQRGSKDHVDGCVVATCLELGGGLIMTSDVNDLKAIRGSNTHIQIHGL